MPMTTCPPRLDALPYHPLLIPALTHRSLAGLNKLTRLNAAGTDHSVRFIEKVIVDGGTVDGNQNNRSTALK